MYNSFVNYYKGICEHKITRIKLQIEIWNKHRIQGEKSVGGTVTGKYRKVLNKGNNVLILKSQYTVKSQTRTERSICKGCIWQGIIQTIWKSEK